MPKKNLYQQMTKDYKYSLYARTGGSFEDAARNYRDRNLTNEQLMVRVNEAIQRERAFMAMNTERTADIIKNDWESFLNSKLVNLNTSSI